MELKTLVLGIILAVSIFAVKSGIGMYYLTVHLKGRKRRIWAFLGSAISYGLLFMIAFFLIRWLSQIALFPLFNKILKFGMPLHFSLAFGMLIWAVYLLKRDHTHTVSKAFLTLVIPCPVCMTVVLLITGFVLTYFPKHGGWALVGVYGVYLLLQLLTMGGFALLRHVSRMEADRALGWGMLLIASYFILTVLVAPQMGGLNKIYRIATYKGEVALLKFHWIIAVWLTMALTFLAGLFFGMFKLKRSK